MTAEAPFSSLVAALDDEIRLLEQLRDLGVEAREPLLRLDVATVEKWVTQHRNVLVLIEGAARVRADLQEACLPPRARGIAGGGGLANTVTLHALCARAPAREAGRLRQQRDALRLLRDEISAVSARNEVLIAQVLEMTDHLGDGLADAARQDGYDAAGRTSDVLMSGELFNGAL